MAVVDKLAKMAQYASEVQEVLDKEVELLEFTKRRNDQGQEVLAATTRTGTPIEGHPTSPPEFHEGGWWFVQVVRENGRTLARPLIRFTPELYFEAKPIERLWVEKTFEREQKTFATDVAGDVIEWTPLTRQIKVLKDGRLELGEFAAYFPQGLAFANIGRARGEAAPLLGVAPTESRNAFKIEQGHLVVPRLSKVLSLTEDREFTAEWNDERKMLLVYLEGVNPALKL